MVKFGSSRMGSRKGSVAIFDYQLLEDATDKFSQSNVLLESGSGRVYKARFDEKLLAAVKKLEQAAGSDAERRFDVTFFPIQELVCSSVFAAYFLYLFAFR